MNLRNFVVLMVVGIVVMAFAPIAPCRAGWVPGGGDTSGGAPDSDDDNDSGTGWSWEWEYDTSGVSRGGDQYGCWAQADMTYNVYLSVDVNGPASVSVSAPADRWLSVYAEYDYDNIPDTGYRWLDYERDAYISGNVQIYGYIVNANLGPNDYAWSDAYAGGIGDVRGDGYGAVMGYMQEFSTGNPFWTVGGLATRNPGTNPTIYNNTGYYSVDLDFTIDVYDDPPDIDSVGGPSSVTISTELYIEVDGTASVDVSAGYYGRVDSDATASLDGYSIVDVVLHN